MTNYLNDNIANLINKEAKKQTSIVKAATNINKAYGTAETLDIKLKADREIIKTQTQAQVATTKANAAADLAKAEAAVVEAKAQSEVLKAEAETKVLESKTKVKEVKTAAMQKLVDANRAKLERQCASDVDAIELDASFIKKVSALEICLGDNGKITSGACSSSDEAYTLSALMI